MSSRTANRATLYRSAWDGGAASRPGRYAARRARNSVFCTVDGMTRELLRAVRD